MPPRLGMEVVKKMRLDREANRAMIGEGMRITIDTPWPGLEVKDREMIYIDFCLGMKKSNRYCGGVCEGKELSYTFDDPIMLEVFYYLPTSEEGFGTLMQPEVTYLSALINSYKELQLEKRKSFLSLSLDERVRQIFSPNRPEVQSFMNIRRIALEEEDGIEELFTLLVNHALLVQGSWVRKSSLVLKDVAHILFRDSILYLFKISEFIPDYFLLMSRENETNFKRILLSLADEIEDPISGWKFRGKQDYDFEFYMKYPNEVEIQQMNFWITIRDTVFTNKCLMGRPRDGETIKLEDKAAICLVLPRIFENNPVRCIGALFLDLAEMARPGGVLSEDACPEVLAFRALVCTKVEMVRVLVEQFAHYVHNSYVKKEAATVCGKKLREAVVELYKKINEGDGIRKRDVVAELKGNYDAEFTKLDIFDELFTKSMTEIADPKDDPKAGDGVIWFLKSGE